LVLAEEKRLDDDREFNEVMEKLRQSYDEDKTMTIYL